MSLADFAEAMHLRRRRSLRRYEKGEWEISAKLQRSFDEWKRGAPEKAEVVTTLYIPPRTKVARGTEVFNCATCGEGFLRMNKRKKHCERKCSPSYIRRIEKVKAARRATKET